MNAIAHSFASQSPEVSVPVHGPALQAALMAGLDRMAHGVAVFDNSGRTLFANASARALFLRLGWAASTDGALRRGDDWSAALHRVCQHGRREMLSLTAHKTTLVVALSPLQGPPTGLAFAIFGRDELCGCVELQMFALRHKLTHAETQVLRQLCRGLQAADIARENGVARTTVLTQIAAIRSKTASASIRNLLDALARMPQMAPLLPVSLA